MANGVTIRVEGLKDLDRALGELTKSAGKAVLRRVAKKALEPFDKAWRQKAPKLSGDLAQSGGIGTKLTRRQASLNRKREGKASIEIFAGPNNPAAVPQEFGTVDQRAQPFVRPAWEQTQDQVLTIVVEGLGSEIDKTAKRAAAKAARLAAKG